MPTVAYMAFFSHSFPFILPLCKESRRRLSFDPLSTCRAGPEGFSSPPFEIFCAKLQMPESVQIEPSKRGWVYSKSGYEGAHEEEEEEGKMQPSSPCHRASACTPTVCIRIMLCRFVLTIAEYAQHCCSKSFLPGLTSPPQRRSVASLPRALSPVARPWPRAPRLLTQHASRRLRRSALG